MFLEQALEVKDPVGVRKKTAISECSSHKLGDLCTVIELQAITLCLVQRSS